MRNLLKSFVALAAVTLAAAMTLTACKKDNPAPEPPITEVGGQTNQRVWADQTSGTGQVSFETTASWTSSITEVGTTRDTAPGVPATWVTITPSSGAAGNHNITIELDTNYTGSDRTAIITINCGGESIPITVTQKATTQSGEVPVQTVAATGVSVKPVTLALKTGATATLAATVAPENATNKAVTWKSDKPAVATVDAATGEVAGIAPGSAVVTATTADGGHEAICAVTITRPVSGIAVAPAELKLETGDTATLTATVAPDDATDKTFAWSSSAPTIATVDAATGEVKAVAPGTATITATTTDGAQTASCAVTVIAPINVLDQIPDAALRAVIQTQYMATWDTNGDGRLSLSEAAKVTRISFQATSNSVSSLKGIEYFTALTHLNCSDNQLTSLDLSNNTALTELACTRNRLTSLDVSKNTALTELSCYYNQLTSLDVSNNTALATLWVSWNELTSLDLSKNTALKQLQCSNNKLTSLDISKNKALLPNSFVFRDNPGDGVSKFPVKAWFDNNSMPNGFNRYSWTYNGKTITIDYRKAP